MKWVKDALLACGLVSSLVYTGMLVFIPAGWPEYSSAAHTVSELSAVDAPTRNVWVSFGIGWTLLYMAFGVGIWSTAQRSRALRAVGVLIVVAGVFGLFWPPMHQRAVLAAGGGTLTDTLHIVWTAVNGVLTIGAMALGAVAFRGLFRSYTIVTIVVLVVAGVLTSMDAPRVEADLPTPWIGVWERVNIGAWLLWIFVLSVMLLRDRRSDGTAGGGSARVAHSLAEGYVDPAFEEVRTEFERNFTARSEIGAAVAVYWRGKKVVDLWGGRRIPTSDVPWEKDTMVFVASTTKGVSAMTIALAHARGLIEYDAPVARYWPEFAQNGKDGVTVRQLLGHEAGLVLLDEKLSIEKLRDLDVMADLLARQTPAWEPGTRHGYHTLTLGFYMQELIRRVDPSHRSLGQFFREEIAEPLGVDFHIGLPADIPGERLAVIKKLSPWRGLMALAYTPVAVTLKMIRPGSLLRRSFVGLGANPNDHAFLEVEVPAGNGVGTARALARLYSVFAQGGSELGLTPETFDLLCEPPTPNNPVDTVLGIPSYFSLGFLRPGPDGAFGSSPRSFGSPGAGGSFAFADPDARVGYAYVMNRMDFYLSDDPREKTLRDAVYRSIARRSGQCETAQPPAITGFRM